MAYSKKEFWKKYFIPFKVGVSIKPTPSGYSASSAGNGTNNKTVYHAIAIEDMKVGRFSRKRGEYFCTQPSFIPYSACRVYQDDERPAVTCKVCLQRLEKFKLEKN